MIQALVDRFMANKAAIRAAFATEHPADYMAIVRSVVEAITSPNEYGDGNLDPTRIHEIDDGDYQGTLVFVIAEKGYQPSDYWYLRVSYGSCSGCDTLEHLRGYDDKPPTEAQIDGYMTLALYVVQGIKQMEGGDVV